MAITYRVSKCANPKFPESENYLSCKNVKTGDYDFETLAEDIAESTTVTKADAMAVLAAIKPKVKKALLAGQRVVLSELGSFVISLQGKSYNADTMADEEFRPSGYIKGHRIVFRAEPALKKEIARDISLKRISSEAMA
jgi:predicted histone-like DNA-binding protein